MSAFYKWPAIIECQPILAFCGKGAARRPRPRLCLRFPNVITFCSVSSGLIKQVPHFTEGVIFSSGAAWLLQGNLRVQLGFGSGSAVLLTQHSSSSAVAMGCSCKLGNGGAHQSQKNWLTTQLYFDLCLCTGGHDGPVRSLQDIRTFAEWESGSLDMFISPFPFLLCYRGDWCSTLSGPA